MKYLCKCEYCGTEWTDEEHYSWKGNVRKCPHCAETKNIVLKQLPSEEGMDVFGYRFSKSFPSK